MSRKDYSWSERALVWASLMLAVMAVTTLSLRYVINPIDCWAPAQFEDSHLRYTDQHCYSLPYVLPMTIDDRVAPNQREKFAEARRPTYHQLVPAFLGLAALLCLVPHAVWTLVSGLLWLDVHAFVEEMSARLPRPEGRLVWLQGTAQMVRAGLTTGDGWLAVAAVARKTGVLAVCVVQTLLMAFVFAPRLDFNLGSGDNDDSNKNDFNVMSNDHDDKNNGSGVIPLPTEPFRCSFEIRQLTNVHPYVVQCTLPIARLYSLLLAFCFHAFLLLSVGCALDTALWSARTWLPGLGDSVLTRCRPLLLGDGPQSSPGPRAHWSGFVHSLGVDGRLVVRATADACGPLTATDLVSHLWTAHQQQAPPAPPPPGPLHTSPPGAGVTAGQGVDGGRGGADNVPLVDIGSEKEKPC